MTLIDHIFHLKQAAEKLYGVKLDASAYLPLVRTAGLSTQRRTATGVRSGALGAGIAEAIALIDDMKVRNIPRNISIYEGR